MTSTNFTDIVLDEDKDVLLLLHAQDCEPCSHFAVFFKRAAMRLLEYKIPNLVIARMDVTNESPPKNLNILVGKLPILAMINAGQKFPPYKFYSGVGKVQSLMKWVSQEVSEPVTLPNLPHLSDEDKVCYY